MKIGSLFLFFVFLFFPVAAAESVGIKTIFYIDSKSQRPIIADIYYPVQGGQKEEPLPGVMVRSPCVRDADIMKGKIYPLIILSHGYKGSREHLTWFAQALSAKGYIVAAIEHFGNSSSFDTPKIALQRWLRPKDVTAFLDVFLKDDQWKNAIDADRIGFAGFSLGGLTGVWVLGGIADLYTKPTVGTSSLYELAIGATQEDVDSIDYGQAKKSYRDTRIQSAFLMAPAHGFSFSLKGLEHINRPVFIVVGDNDTVAPITENAGHYARHIQGAEFKVLEGNISHLAFRNQIQPDKVCCVSSFDFETNPNVDVSRVHEQTATLAIDFFDRTLKK